MHIIAIFFVNQKLLTQVSLLLICNLFEFKERIPNIYKIISANNVPKSVYSLINVLKHQKWTIKFIQFLTS